MKKTFLAFLALSSNAFAGAYVEHVAAIKKQRPYEKNKIDQIDKLTVDLVLHYEDAVIVGTTPEYEELTKINHFDSFLDASDKICGEINLASCIYDLICEDKIIHNFKTSIMPCR